MNTSLIRNLFDTICQFRYRLLAASLMVTVANGLLILNPLIFREALLAFDPAHESTFFGPFFRQILGPYYHQAYAWALLLLTIALISAFFRYSMRTIFLSVSREVELEMREKLFERIQSQSKMFFDRHGVGDLLSRLTNDITAYRDMLGPGLMYPMHFVSLVIPALLALFTISPFMTFVSLIPIFGIYLLNLWVRNPILHISQKVQESLADMSTMAHEHYSGIKLIKSYGIERSMLKLFEGLCRVFGKLNMRFATFQGIFFPALILITKVVTLALVVVAGAVILLQWGPPISLADFLSFMWIQSYIFSPLLMMAWVVPMYQRGKAAYGRLIEIYQEPIEIYQAPHALAHIPPKADIEFRDLDFAYPTQKRTILSHFNLSIKGGSFVGITGPVGAGKSTLFRLLNREYEVPPGTILIGGKDIHEYALKAFHQQIVTVEQLPFLFSKSIRENISFGRQEADEMEIEEVARLAGLHEEVSEFPLQYDTVVGERGVGLSGGQKQRVALARALLVDRSILLFDDVFSAVDAETERKVFQSMQRNFVGKTVLIITHRINILSQLDRVIYMNNGKIEEDGTPQELVKRQGPYSMLVDLQKMQEMQVS